MENHSADGPTFDLKVNTCCEQCASKIKEKLQELNGVNSISTIHEEKEMVQENNEKEPHGSIDDVEKDVVAVTYTKRKNTRAKIFRKQISRLKKMARVLVSYKIKNLLSRPPKKSKPSANQAPLLINSVPNVYKKKIVSRAKNCQYCSESDSDRDEDKQKYINVPRRAPPLGTVYTHRRPLSLVHQANMRPSSYVNNWRRPPPPPPPRQPPLLLPPHHPPYGSQNPYCYNLMPPPHFYGYQNPYSHDFMNRMDVPRPMYSYYPYYYGQKPRDPPVGNSFIHFLSDENTASGCSIM